MIFVFLIGLSDTSNPCPFGYQECIVDYRSGIKVYSDASVIVKEDIKVRATGHNIKHGIYRDFPLVYRDSRGNRYSVEFEIKEVLLNDKPVPFFTRRLSNGIRIYIGDKNAFLEPGYYRYTLIYKTERQIGFFDDHDELYWNVTGNGWNFPIRRVEAVVVLPDSVPTDSVRFVAYTGFAGDRGQDYRAFIHRNMVVFRTTRPLRPGEGLSVAVAFPRGYVIPPPLWKRLYWILKDNRGGLIMVFGFILIIFFYLWAWGRVGKDPKKGIIMPRFKPPRGFSPAMMRYLWKMDYDEQALAANLIDLAVRGYVRIVREDDRYRVEKTGKSPERDELPEDEALLLDSMPESVDLDREGSRLSSILKSRLSLLMAPYLRFNYGYTLFGWVMTFLLIFVAFYMSWGGLVEWITIFLLGGILVALGIAFFRWMKAPTPEGRRLLDEIEGFRMFLERAEKERLRKLYPEDSMPEIFERFLPHALALDVDDNWAGAFADELERTDYAPSWYVGPSTGSFYPGRGASMPVFVRDFSRSVSHSISASSNPPGSTSGFGRGGYSGGGGGGGGGGGW